VNSVIFMPVLLTLYAPSIGTGKCWLSISSLVADRRLPVRPAVSFQLIDTKEVNDDEALISSTQEDEFDQLSGCSQFDGCCHLGSKTSPKSTIRLLLDFRSKWLTFESEAHSRTALHL
jgi:hypothetical protein